MKPQSLSELASCLIVASCFASGCSSSTGTTDGGSSGSAPIAGTSATTGGASAGGGSPASSGAPGTSGSGTAIAGTSGSVGGQASGGQSSGGQSSGGQSSGGQSSGGSSGTGGSSGVGKSAGCGKMPSIPSSQYNNGTHIAITAANMEREYILNVPANYDNTHPYKFVIAYHELNGNDDEMYRNKYYHLLPLSNDSTIFVAPNGQQNNKNCTAAANCGWPNPNDSDMLLADAVVAQIEQNFCIDTNRIFATGWSYGASMSYQTACERPLGSVTNGVAGYIRSVAVYSAAQLSPAGGSCKPSKPVAYYASHGTNDTVLDYTTRGLPLLQNMVAVDGCTAMTPTKVTSGNHVCTNFMGCSAGYPVEFCSFNGPHTPDPTDPGQQTSWEYQNVWTFLSQF